MRESEHPEQTFAQGSFGRLVKKHGITMEIMPINPVTMSEDPNVKATNIFVVALHKGLKSYVRTIEFERVFRELPTTEDVLEYLLNEMIPFVMYFENLPGLAKALGLPLADPRIRVWYEEAKRGVKDFRDTLGPEVLDDMLQIKEIRGPAQLPEA